MACAGVGGRISFRVEAAFECCSRLDLWTSRLWQKVDLEGSHIHIFHPAL